MSPVSTKSPSLSGSVLPMKRDAVRGERICREPSTTRISTAPEAPTKDAGNPSSPSVTSKPTPASVEA